MYSFYESARSKKFGRTSANMYLQFKWDMENYATHRYNVKTAKPSIDNSAPRTFTHMFIRPKKLQLELERYSTIQRNNRFLLERLATIRREGAWIDNKNYHDIKSLNTWKRQQEMISLAHNNQIMLARLQDVGAGLNRHKLEDEYLMNQKHKANVLKYPPNWREIQEHLVKLKKETFKKVFDSKYQRREYEKSRKKVLKRWATEREKHEAAKAEKLDKTLVINERQEALTKKKKGEVGKGQKKTLGEALKKSSNQENMRKEKLKFDQNRQKTDIKKETPINGKGEGQKKMQPKKPLSKTAPGSASKKKNVENKEEIRSEPQKVKPVSSTGFNFKGDSKPIKEICDRDEQTEQGEKSQDPKVVLKEENEPFYLNERISNVAIENGEFSTSSESSQLSESEDGTSFVTSEGSKQSESADGISSVTSEGSKQSEESKETKNEEDTMGNYDSSTSQDEDGASDSLEDENETELSDVSNEKTDYESENFESPDTSDSDTNAKKENKKNSDQSHSDETRDSKEKDEET